MYDRAITSAPLRKLINKLVSDGILPNPSTNMQVSAGNGMNVLVEAGFAICGGCLKLEESQRTLAVQASDATYDRIDTVVLRLNDNDSERICDFYVLQGVPASSPVRPSLTRTESIWEIGLADLFITPNSSEISNQRITDTRYETERCGVISAISEFDTTTLYNQIQADLAGFKAEEQAQFIEWFDYMKGQLSEDAAGNLQLQIDEINELDYVEAEELEELVPKENIRTSFGKLKVAVKNLIVIAKLLGDTDISKIEDGTVTGILNALNTKAITTSNIGSQSVKYAQSAGSCSSATTAANATEHINNKDNPHSVTKSDVGLGNVPNVATNDQTPTYSALSTLTALVSGEKLSVAFRKIQCAVANLISHLADKVSHITDTERAVWNANSFHRGYAYASGTVALSTTAFNYISSAWSGSGGTGFSYPNSGIRVQNNGYYDILLEAYTGGSNATDYIKIGYREYVDASNYEDVTYTKWIAKHENVTFVKHSVYLEKGVYIRPIAMCTTAGTEIQGAHLTVTRRYLS